MLGNQFLLPVHHELVVDLFAGGGGASTGIEQAIGRHVDVAVNHDREAILDERSPNHGGYCDDCPARRICPHDNKEWSQ